MERDGGGARRGGGGAAAVGGGSGGRRGVAQMWSLSTPRRQLPPRVAPTAAALRLEGDPRSAPAACFEPKSMRARRRCHWAAAAAARRRRRRSGCATTAATAATARRGARAAAGDEAAAACAPRWRRNARRAPCRRSGAVARLLCAARAECPSASPMASASTAAADASRRARAAGARRIAGKAGCEAAEAAPPPCSRDTSTCGWRRRRSGRRRGRRTLRAPHLARCGGGGGAIDFRSEFSLALGSELG